MRTSVDEITLAELVTPTAPPLSIGQRGKGKRQADGKENTIGKYIVKATKIKPMVKARRGLKDREGNQKKNKHLILDRTLTKHSRKCIRRH